MKSVTQQLKITPLRTLVMRSLQGLPINCQQSPVFDLEDNGLDVDDDFTIFDESSDPLDVQNILIEKQEELVKQSVENRKKREKVAEEFKKAREIQKDKIDSEIITEHLKRKEVSKNEIPSQSPPQKD